MVDLFIIIVVKSSVSFIVLISQGKVAAGSGLLTPKVSVSHWWRLQQDLHLFDLGHIGKKATVIIKLVVVETVCYAV